MAEEEWELPIGLTKEYAISINDSSDDEVGSKSCADGADKVSNTTNTIQSLQYYESIKGGISTASSSSYFSSSKPTTLTTKADDKHRVDSCTLAYDNTQEVSIKSNNDSADDNMVVDNTKPSQDEGKADNTTKNDNPFASFAFTSGEASSVPSSSSSSSWRSKKKLSHTNSKSSSHNNKQHTKRKNDNNGISSSVVTKKAKQAPPHSFFNKSTGRSEDDIILCKNKKIERQELITKWHKFADRHAPIEQQRFQVLVAARLHARCQEPVVLKAMDNLRKYFNEKDENEGRLDNNEVQATSKSLSSSAATTYRSQQTLGQGLTVHNLANADPETEIAPLLKSVLFGNVKSKHIVQASKDVLQKFGGRVPESIVSLKSIMGIGPELAGVLNIVNKVDTYTQRQK